MIFHIFKPFHDFKKNKYSIVLNISFSMYLTKQPSSIDLPMFEIVKESRD